MLVTLVLARVLAEPGAPAPDVADDAILVVKRTAQVGEICDSPPGSDGGVPDGGVPDDAGLPDGGAVDGGLSDGGVDDGGVPSDAIPGDGGVPDGGLVCVPVNGDVISLVVQPRFTLSPGGGRFALLYVTPGYPVVQTYASNVFEELAEVTAPRVEVHRIEIPDPAYGKACPSVGCGYEAAPEQPTWDPSFTDAGVPGDGGGGPPGVETVGAYEVVRAQPTTTAELAGWLDGLGYVYQQEDLDATAPYIARGYTVVALRVVVNETSAMSPVALTWQGSTLTLPAAFGAASTGATDVYIAGDQRYELDGAYTAFAARTGWGETAWLTRNQLVLASASADEDPVAHAQGTTEYIPVHVVEEEVHVPVSDCGDLDVGCCPACNSARGPSPTSVGGSLAVLVLVGRRRRPRRR